MPAPLLRRLHVLALVAIGFVACVPTVSRVVASVHACAASARTTHALHAVGGDHAGHGGAGAVHGEGCGHDLDACGYCDMLTHSPLASTVAPPVVPSPTPPAAPGVSHRVGAAHRMAVRAAQPRGPPVVLD